MRPVKAALLASPWFLALAFGGCSEPGAGAAGGEPRSGRDRLAHRPVGCYQVLVLPRDPVLVRFLPGEPPVRSACPSMRCFEGSHGVFARLTDEGARRIEVVGLEPVVLPALYGHHLAGVVYGPKLALVTPGRIERGGGRNRGYPAGKALLLDGQRGLQLELDLPAVERGWSDSGVLREDEAIFLLQRKDDAHEVRRVLLSGQPTAGYELEVRRHRERIGHLAQAPDSLRWQAVLDDGRTVDLADFVPCPECRVWGQGPWLYAAAKNRAWIVPPTGETFAVQERDLRGPDVSLAWTSEGAFAVDLTKGLYELAPEGPVPLHSWRPGLDLLGRALPPGTERALGQVAWSPARGALLQERIRLADCATEDRIYLFDYATRKLTALAEGPGMRSHPRWAGDRFGWVEAEVESRFVSTDAE